MPHEPYCNPIIRTCNNSNNSLFHCSYKRRGVTGISGAYAPIQAAVEFASYSASLLLYKCTYAQLQHNTGECTALRQQDRVHLGKLGQHKRSADSRPSPCFTNTQGRMVDMQAHAGTSNLPMLPQAEPHFVSSLGSQALITTESNAIILHHMTLTLLVLQKSAPFWA